MDSKYEEITNKFIIASEKERKRDYRGFFFSERCAGVASPNLWENYALSICTYKNMLYEQHPFRQDTYASYDNSVRDRDLPREI